METLIGLIVGHSSESQGAYNKTHNVSEYEFNCNLALLVQDELTKLGLKSQIFYRTKGVPLLVQEVNKVSPTLAVSLHCNAFNELVSGTEVLYYYKSMKSKKLASLLQKNIVDTLGLRDRGTLPIEQGRGTYVLKNTTMPCALIEPFFIDNIVDYELVLSKLNDLASAIANSVYSFLNDSLC